MRFLSTILATIIGLFLFIFLAFMGLLIMGAVLGTDEKSTDVAPNSVLVLDLSATNLDYNGKADNAQFNWFEKPQTGFIDIINAIKKAKNDERIVAISIKNKENNLGMAQAKELRNAIADFKKSKKTVWAYADSYNQKGYYISSVADKIFINPAGDFNFRGLSAEVLFFKDFQEKSGLKMEVIRHGKYKSAVEPFLENEMSEANREQTLSLLQSAWGTMLQDIAQNRKTTVAQLNSIADNVAAQTPQNAQKYGFVDAVLYADQYELAFKKQLKVANDEDIETVNIQDYAAEMSTEAAAFDTEKQVAVIYAQGEILGGEGDTDYIGEEAMNEALKEAREDENTIAVVLRIDSPGGSALVSELIWREIGLTKKVKPVVVSMGNVAASGGYYLACNAHRIFAQPNTITGSIGVFGSVPNVQNLAAKIGINATVISTNNQPEYSIFKPMTQEQRNEITVGIEHIYQTFLQRVAQGRKLTTQQVDAVAQGRVWTGVQAQKIGLVDELGGLNDAIAYAAKLAKTKEYTIVNFPEFELSFEKSLQKATGISLATAQNKWLSDRIGAENMLIVEQLKNLKIKKGIQAKMPFDIVFK